MVLLLVDLVLGNVSEESNAYTNAGSRICNRKMRWIGERLSKSSLAGWFADVHGVAAGPTAGGVKRFCVAAGAPGTSAR
jgi:hypothetical protein